MDQLIKTEDLTFKYSGEGNDQVVLDGISLSIPRGQFVAVIGHNGSGKSTLAKHFNAILLPCGGKVYIDGMDTVNEEQLLSIRQTVGMVFQNPDNQIVATIVEEDVAFAPENLGLEPAQIRKRVDEALKTVGMEAYANHSAHMLSGGQKQRVAIAGVIAMRPKRIVLDEPTAMLDPIGREEVLRTVLSLNREYGITAVLITHNMEEAAMAQRVVAMSMGQIVLDGTPETVFVQVEKLMEIGLTVPQTVMLMYKLWQNGVDAPLDCLTPEQCAGQLKRILTEGRAE